MKEIKIGSLAAAWRKDMCVEPVSPPKPVAKPSPWLIESRVLFAVAQRCPCGAVYSSYQPSLGVRFRHRKTDLIWIIANHPSLWNSSLPWTVEWREERLTKCPSCLPRAAVTSSEQLSFSFDFLGLSYPGT